MGNVEFFLLFLIPYSLLLLLGVPSASEGNGSGAEFLNPWIPGFLRVAAAFSECLNEDLPDTSC